MPGMRMSSRTRSGGCSSTSAKASAPDAAGITVYPWEPSTASSSLILAGVSSTTRIRPVSGTGAPPFARWPDVAPDLIREGLDVDRLGQVPVEPRRGQPLAVRLHHRRGEGDDRDGLRSGLRTQLLKGAHSVSVGKLDVHEHEIGLVLDGQLDALGCGHGLKRPEPPVQEDVACQLEVLVVVFHDEDESARHVDLLVTTLVSGNSAAPAPRIPPGRSVPFQPGGRYGS